MATGIASEKAQESCNNHSLKSHTSFRLTREGLKMRLEGEVGQIMIHHVSFIL